MEIKDIFDYLDRTPGQKEIPNEIKTSDIIKTFSFLSQSNSRTCRNILFSDDSLFQNTMSAYKYISNMFKLFYVTYTPFDIRYIPVFTTLYVGTTFSKGVVSNPEVLEISSYHQVIHKEMFNMAVKVLRELPAQFKTGEQVNKRALPTMTAVDILSNSGALRLLNTNKRLNVATDAYTSEQFDLLLKKGKRAFCRDVTDWIFPILPKMEE